MNLSELLIEAQKMRGEMQRVQDSLATKTVEGTAGGGMVKVTANGKHQITKVEIDQEAWKLNDREMIQDLVLAGVNQALKGSQDMMAEEMKKMAGGLGPLASLLK